MSRALMYLINVISLRYECLVRMFKVLKQTTPSTIPWVIHWNATTSNKEGTTTIRFKKCLFVDSLEVSYFSIHYVITPSSIQIPIEWCKIVFTRSRYKRVFDADRFLEPLKSRLLEVIPTFLNTTGVQSLQPAGWATLADRRRRDFSVLVYSCQNKK